MSYIINPMVDTLAKDFLEDGDRYIEVVIASARAATHEDGKFIIGFHHTEANGDLDNPKFTQDYKVEVVTSLELMAFIYKGVKKDAE